jgi:serine phosphatase RsbU (regulator of sigma subunit)
LVWEEPTIGTGDSVEASWSGARRAQRSLHSTSLPDDTSLAAVELAADIIDVTPAREIRKRLLTGLVRDLAMDGAALWVQSDREQGWKLREHVGLPPDVVDTVARWPAGWLSERVVRAAAEPDGRVVADHHQVEWDGQTLYVVAIPQPTGEVLGVFAPGAASDTVMRLVVALARMYASAAAQADTMRHNQHVVDAMVDELRPTDGTLPGGYALGHLYRSATAGVAIGGDLYDWFRTDRGAFGVAVGDVSGKGMQAASRTAMAVHSLRAFALPGASPHVAAKMLNTVVTARFSNDSFADPGSAKHAADLRPEDWADPGSAKHAADLRPEDWADPGSANHAADLRPEDWADPGSAKHAADLRPEDWADPGSAKHAADLRPDDWADPGSANHAADLRAENFLTLIYVHVEPGSSDVGFVLAGHPPPILVTLDAVEVLSVEADLPIGLDATATFHLHHAALRPGGSLVLYTDGVTEARAADGALLETAGLVRLLGELRGRSAQQMADGVWRGVQEHTAGDTTDDVAVVVLQRVAGAPRS